MTPMMQQYCKTKEEYKDCILFYRLGDFYEMFFEDALTASKELEITLTGKDCGMEERAPMCGIPYHAYENYMNRLVEKGYKVAKHCNCQRIFNHSRSINIFSFSENLFSFLIIILLFVTIFTFSIRN